MNPVFHAASEANQLGDLMGVITLIFIVTFIGWTAWAWWPANRLRMEAWARIPLDDDDSAGGAS